MEAGQEYDLLASLVENNDLSSAIRKVLKAHTGHFLSKTINEAFRPHDKGSLYDLLIKSTDIDPPRLREITDEEIRPFLYIRHETYPEITQRAADMIERYLQELDVLYYDRPSDRDIFIQPGMRYAQSMELADALQNNSEFRGYAPADQRLILQKLETDIRGQILEDVVFYQVLRQLDQDHFAVGRYRDENGWEIDLLIENVDQGVSAAIEIKFSNVPDKGQWKHLNNQDFIRSVELKRKTKIADKAVVYTGATGRAPYDNGIYLNAEDLLTEPDYWISRLLETPDLHLPQIQ